MEFRIIDKYKNNNNSELKAISLSELIKIYQGNYPNTENTLLNDVENLFLYYKNKNKLKNCINQYSDAINCLLNFNHAFFIRFLHEEKKIDKINAYYFIASTQVQLTKLQNYHNQMVYKKQRIEYCTALTISIIAFIAAIVFYAIPHK